MAASRNLQNLFGYSNMGYLASAGFAIIVMMPIFLFVLNKLIDENLREYVKEIEFLKDRIYALKAIDHERSKEVAEALTKLGYCYVPKDWYKNVLKQINRHKCSKANLKRVWSNGKFTKQIGL